MKFHLMGSFAKKRLKTQKKYNGNLIISLQPFPDIKTQSLMRLFRLMGSFGRTREKTLMRQFRFMELFAWKRLKMHKKYNDNLILCNYSPTTKTRTLIRQSGLMGPFSRKREMDKDYNGKLIISLQSFPGNNNTNIDQAVWSHGVIC